MDNLDNLFANNKNWARKMVHEDPGFFSKLCHLQAPRYLWIGCSDSRVPANEIVGLLPGELFVHRNVANQVIHTDFNCLSVLQYAVEVLGVEHVIVCGHYGCGGVIASLQKNDQGLISNWLRHIQDIRKIYEKDLRVLSVEDQQNILCELNVREQLIHLGETTILQNVWASDRHVAIHGWIYSLRHGRLKKLFNSVSSQEQLQALVEEKPSFSPPPFLDY